MKTGLICECGAQVFKELPTKESQEPEYQEPTVCPDCDNMYQSDVDYPISDNRYLLIRYNKEKGRYNINAEKVPKEYESVDVKTDTIKFFDVHNIYTVLEVPFKESLVPLKGQELVFHNCDNPDDLMSVTARLTGYLVLNVYRSIYNDGTVVVHVDVKNNKDLK